MATPDELDALADTLVEPNDEIMHRAAKYLRNGDRDGLETAHNLLVDIVTNYALLDEDAPSMLPIYVEELRVERIETYGSVGRTPEMTPPYWKEGW